MFLSGYRYFIDIILSHDGAFLSLYTLILLTCTWFHPRNPLAKRPIPASLRFPNGRVWSSLGWRRVRQVASVARYPPAQLCDFSSRRSSRLEPSMMCRQRARSCDWLSQLFCGELCGEPVQFNNAYLTSEKCLCSTNGCICNVSSAGGGEDFIGEYPSEVPQTSRRRFFVFQAMHDA